MRSATAAKMLLIWFAIWLMGIPICREYWRKAASEPTSKRPMVASVPPKRMPIAAAFFRA
jgi:hypothetical protein